MPAIRLSAFKYYTLFISSIAYYSEIINLYSYCAKKGLVYIIIADPSSHQLFFYLEYTKLNTCVLCDIHSVSFNKYIFLICLASL